MLHPDDNELFERAAALGHRLAANIGKTCVIEPKRRPFGAGGLCYHSERPQRIAILIRQKEPMYAGGAWSHRPLGWSTIANTVAHEVAHLVHRGHGAEFKKLEAELIDMI